MKIFPYENTKSVPTASNLLQVMNSHSKWCTVKMMFPWNLRNKFRWDTEICILSYPADGDDFLHGYLLLLPQACFVFQMRSFCFLSCSWALLFLRNTGEQLEQWGNGKNNTNPAYSSWHWQPECCLVWQRAETITHLITKQVSNHSLW